MSNYLLAPLEGQVIKVLCIDNDNTKSMEDGFRITRQNGITQIDIVCPIPPQNKISKEKVMFSLSRWGVTYNKSFCTFLSREEQINFGINRKSPCEVLVVTYIIDANGLLILEELSIAKARGVKRSYVDYGLSFDSAIDRLDFSRVIATKPELWKYIAKPKPFDFVSSPRAAHQIVNMSVQLFNRTCRDAARKEDIPFIAKKPSGLASRQLYLDCSHAIFKQTLRDPTALVNTYNIADAINGKPLTFSEAYLKHRLRLQRENKLLY